MIPKKIHYCWFGGGPIPQKDQKCIESWKKFCPDYEIVQWNETNYDIRKNKYMSQAYDAKRWGFVPDFARFDIIFNEGGFYLDTDVELLRSLDELRENDAYMGFEGGNWVNGGIGFGAIKGHELIRELRDMYDAMSFVNEDGTLNLLPSPHYITEFLETKGLERNDTMQEINGMTIYPKEYFAPKDYYSGKMEITDNSISIHQYNASWQTPHKKRMLKVRRIIGDKLYFKLVDIKKYILKK
ncbi:MAG: glycosyltransferase family 32 protein [Sphaerochaeta sp.]